MTRSEFIKHCTYPDLPQNTYSLQQLFNSYDLLKQNTNLWLGGRLTNNISDSCLELSTQNYKIKCFLAKNCIFNFNFDTQKSKITKKNLFNCFKKGDHFLIYINKKDQINKTAQSVCEIKDITKITLVSVNKKNNKMLCYPFEVARKQTNWFYFLQNVNECMQKIGLDPTQTPTLVDCPGTEPNISMFKTTKLKDKKKIKLFLSTSPEISLKKLMCHGHTDIYEIKKCFRNQESGPLNHTEFYMLEWYRAYSKLSVLIHDLQFLFNFLSHQIKGKKIPQIKQISMKTLFKQHVDMALKPHCLAQDFIYYLKKHNIPFKDCHDIDDLFYLLFLNKIEPQLDFKTPTVVYDYPVFQKAYARIGPQGWASRFELFWKGMELANAFDEVICPQEQKNRFKEDALKRKQYKKQIIPASSEFLQNMEYGMPPAAGVALGLDRLFLAFYDLTDIQQIRFFVT